MLVVMLILMVATVSAAVSVRTTQAELHAAGQDRLAMQTAYVSEAAIMTTTAYVDKIGDEGGFLDLWTYWQGQGAPTMQEYGEPALTTDTRHNAVRLSQTEELKGQQTNEVPPLSNAVAATGTGGGGTGGGGSGSGGGGAPVDPTGVGSFGPNQAYGLVSSAGYAGYVVDLTDCVPAPAALSPGTQIGGQQTLKPQQFYCVLTARGRLQLNGATSSTRTWTFGASTYTQDAFMTSHDSRATIITPTMWVPVGTP